MKALILAGGFGIRLKEVLHGQPKTMAMVNGKPFLEYLIKLLEKNGINEIILATGYLSGYIIDYFSKLSSLNTKIIFSDSLRPVGTAGSIKKAEAFLDKDFLVINGDTYMDINILDLIEFHSQKKSDLSVVVTQKYHGRGSRVIFNKKTHQVEKFLKAKNEKRTSHHTNAGMYIFNQKILNLLQKDKRCSLEKDLFPLLIKKGYKVYAYPTDKDFIDIGDPEGYLKAKKFLEGQNDS